MSVTLLDPSFEVPVLDYGQFQGGPIDGSPWVFGPGSGLSALNSPFDHENPPAPDGVQCCYLQSAGGAQGEVSQAVVFSGSGGFFVLSGWACLRLSGGVLQAGILVVLLDGSEVFRFTPPSSSWSSWTSAPFLVAVGSHVLALQNGIDPSGDNTVLVDFLDLEPSATASTTVAQPGRFIPRRSRQ